ncbi:mitochondrial ribonuclease P protein 1 homolog [Parasteatoda tepidariorum]|uniref:mitochondrial ribonuclease P protein 1 homolog n=1 Tax=Parasteatoda tepidariorum TaxID=114398 RepID=UPI00077F8148|nr:mitochondrial ribonuclease P protein 1 homolog [Parasteatoda tepidariorum]XP_015930859.1 mitochondrial ribonuclease P protein 1 homolog [Parasteatoda tepidariorum]
MKLMQNLFSKCFQSSVHIYCSSFVGQRFFSRNSNLSNGLLNNSTIIIKNEYFRTEKVTFECLSKFFPFPEHDEKVMKIINEINNAIERKRRCPEFLNPTEFHELYVLETKSQRSKYLSYLFKQEKLKEKDKLIKEEKKETSRKLKNETSFNCDFSKYGLGCKTLLINIRKKSINKFHNQRLANSVLFGNRIVIDLDYDDYMIEKERRSCAAQLRHIIVANKNNHNPFDLYFCNANPTFKCVQYLKHDVPNIEDSLNTFYDESYLDIFPSEQLVYLSPHANESLKSFDPSAIYIIGGFVDVVKKEKISTEKAFTEGIKSYSLPLDDHIKWKSGSKSLTINQVFEIMLILKNTGDWKKAFECIPIRKTNDTKSSEENQHSKNALNVEEQVLQTN